MTELPNQTYQVLARKYRPRTFEDMIGQEAMVTTLTNAFKVGRVAHAFMLTGVRGIGKTTTARLLARALNYESDDVDGPSVDLTVLGRHCEAIMSSSHMDILEMDAASRTGVDNMRELLDGVRYAPVQARYKVYIIDEVHMLSTGAFNALLKTLEEPPDHAKFIFATTEIRKVPITVLSRCQRFDLRRVEGQVLADHLVNICAQENVSVSADGISLIARAAEGSVRDGLSLLDQAIVQSGLSGDEVSMAQIRHMLGLADRERIIDLFDHAVSARPKEALVEMRAQYDDGAAPEVVIRDLLDLCHEVSRAKTLGADAGFDMAPDVIKRVQALAANLSTGQLTRIWHLLLKSHSDVRLSPAPLAAAEMALLALTVASELPPPELAAQIISEIRAGNFTPPETLSGHSLHSAESSQSVQNSQNVQASPIETPPSGAGHPYPTPDHPVSGGETLMRVNAPSQSVYETVPKMAEAPSAAQAKHASHEIKTLKDLVNALPKSAVELKYDIERYVRPIHFKQGAIRFEPAQGAPVTLTGKIVKALQDLTGDLWIVSPETSGGGDTLSEARKRALREQEEKDRAHPAFQHALFKEARLIEIIDKTPISDGSGNHPVSDNVIAGKFGESE